MANECGELEGEAEVLGENPPQCKFVHIYVQNNHYFNHNILEVLM
jgi:hypothetical protein